MSAPQETDVLVLGSGIAGLFYALGVADHGRVMVVTKKTAADTATNLAQGGIAAVQSSVDSFARHEADTLEAGAGLCHPDVVRHVVARGPAMIEALLAAGAVFDRSAGGPAAATRLALGREGGHSRRRIVHHRDTTGREIERALLARARAHPNIEVHENHCAVDLLTAGDGRQARRVVGAEVLDVPGKRLRRLTAWVTLLATGGAGRLWRRTSNPAIATGDGLALAARAGATLANLEFVQFHPTCLAGTGQPPFLISEALRGEGAVLRTRDGTRFMQSVHPLADLAPRDVVARAIHEVLATSEETCVFLDATGLPAGFVEERFPGIFARCLAAGIDMANEPLPVAPAAHYLCGGVRTDLVARTDVAGLLAVGEVACTGLHGANRLASNSLLEALVFADAAAALTREVLAQPDAVAAAAWPEGEAARVSADMVRDDRAGAGHATGPFTGIDLPDLMGRAAGVVRDDATLAQAAEELAVRAAPARTCSSTGPTRDEVQRRNMLTVAELVVCCARRRQESRGLHQNRDHPRRDDRRQRMDTTVRL
ncbi:MAG: L-aspartate oxidase [Acidobacteriota bacterium]